MRSKLLFFGAALPLAALLTGCGTDTSQVISSDLAAPTLSGRAFGGQMPISGALIVVETVGTSGYGLGGTILGSTYTAPNGSFTITNPYTCPQPDTPVFILAIGGDPGYGGDNPNIVNAAGLGTCANAKNSYVTINEVTTAGLAVALANFFSPTIGGSNGQNDTFGGPSTTSGGLIQYSKGLVLGDDYSIPALVDNATGLPIASSANVTVESQKIATIANVLAACINSAPTNAGAFQSCTKLFKWTNSAAGVAPTDTLQAAVEMVLNPTQQLKNLYNLGETPTAPFDGLGTQPNDWSVAISYTTSAAGLGVDTGTVSTLDIDANGNIWFPSNAAGSTGVGYFDQTSRSFNGPFTSTMVHPQQVALDTVGNAWLNDSDSIIVDAYNSTTSAYTPYTIGSFSTAIGVDSNGNTDVGTVTGVTYGLGTISSGAYTPSSFTFTYPVTSLASNNSDGIAAVTTDYIDTQLNDYLVSGGVNTLEITSKKDDSGQVIFTGNDFIAARPYSAGSGDAKDGICIYSLGACYNIKGGTTSSPFGIAIDGAKTLWLSDSGDQSVIEIPINPTSTGTDGGVYLNAKGTSVNGTNFTELLHGTGNGGTLTIPYGIGVDAEGNVWVSNATCQGTGCTATGGFTLTEIVGAATPTITPVSAQIAGGANLVGMEPTQ